MRTPDGKHRLPCTHCGAHTFKASQVCKRCESLAKFDATQFSEEQLVLCAQELARRVEARSALLARCGVACAA